MSIGDQVQFGESGRVPAILRDARSGRLRELIFITPETLARIESSRRLYRCPPGANTTPQSQAVPVEVVQEARLNLHGDCLLLSVFFDETGEDNFTRLLWQDAPPDNAEDDILEAVYHIIQQRRNQDADSSYVASLFAKGLDKILGKIGEEATETAVAGKGGDPDQVVSETADLFFHVLVLLGYYDLPPERIYAELRRRFGISGLVEKAARGR